MCADQDVHAVAIIHRGRCKIIRMYSTCECTARIGHRRGCALLVCLCLCLIGVPAHGTPADSHIKFMLARDAFEAGRNGSVNAIALAQERFRALLAVEPANPLYLAYFGSAYTLQARESTLPWTKIHLVNKGLDLLDQALSALRASDARARAAEQNAQLETRLVAVATFIALPDALFHRLAAAKRTLQEAVTSPAFGHADPDLRGHLLYEGALIARQEHDIAAERTALNQVMLLAPPSIDVAGLRERLAELQ
jgi:hypothetical protein